MALLRRKKKLRPPTNGIELADLHATLQICQEKIEQLERDNETNIKRMGAMQAEIDHLRAKINQQQ